MTDFATRRRMMVDSQVRPSDVTDLRLIGVMEALPRESFLPPAVQSLAYLDLDLAPVSGSARRMLKPMVLSRLVQAAAVGRGDRVLDVGCLTGYSSALLAQLGGAVVALDDDPALTAAAARCLAAVGQLDVVVETGPLPAGAPQHGPYDVILVNGACADEPESLLAQLADGGRLACVQGAGPVGRATLYLRTGDLVGRRVLFDAVAPVLPGFAKEAGFVF
ncbi:MAG TPA: protein-L-isoaspartate O-methyltransferase [Xanthobacteraceae bacterium]|nr:protein-L-isoaspartate O-methyltransferase [Xanthobacteraceae bacterium]